MAARIQLPSIADVPVELHEVRDILSMATLVVLEEVAHVLAGLHDLLVQVVLRDPLHEDVNAVGGVQGRKVDLLGVSPSLTRQAVVQDQSLLVRLETCHSSPGLHLPQVALGLAPISIVFS